MENKSLIENLPFFNQLNDDKKEKFLNYFSGAPLVLLDSMKLVKYDAGVSITNEGEEVKNVYFLVNGVVEAIDLRMYGTPFNYKDFRDVYAFGGMEIILGEETYMTTLQTVTECTLCMLPRTVFEKWLYSDNAALKREARMTVRNLLDEVRNNRLYLFTQGSDRVALLLINKYESCNVNGILRLPYSRQNIADASGVCVKTVGRSIKFFIDENLVTRNDDEIIIDSEQNKRMKEIVSRVVDVL